MHTDFLECVQKVQILRLEVSYRLELIYNYCEICQFDGYP